MSEQQQVEPAEQSVSGQGTRRSRNPVNQQLKNMTASQVHGHMLRDIRSWGWALVVLGAIHLFTSGFLNSAWGILLVVVGLASFYFKDAAIFVVYSVTLAWAAISNLISFSSGWMAFAVIQVILAVQTFRRFQIYRDAQSNLAIDENNPVEFSSTPTEPSQSQILFPVISLILGIAGLGGIVGLNAIALIAGVIGLDVPQAVFFSIDLSLDLGILGLAIGLAAILSDFPKRGQAIVGSIAGGLAMGLQLGLFLLVTLL